MVYSIGTTYEGKNLDYLTQILPVVDHIEVSPDSIVRKKNGKIVLDPEAIRHLEWMSSTSNTQLLIHGVGLSIGSYDGYSSQYIELLDELFDRFDIRWHSEHLGYTMVNGENLGTMLTLPRTDEVVDMLCFRIRAIQDRFKVPFLMENVISMLPQGDWQYSDAAFLNKITRSTGCGLVLDVYNLECDRANFNLDIDCFLDELDLNSVREMHLAGGPFDPEFNFKMDIHMGCIAGSTINLAQSVIDRGAKNLTAITFEILEEFVEQVGSENIISEIKHLNQIFNSDEPKINSD